MPVKNIEENEKMFRLLFEQSTDAMMIFDGHVFVDCNQAAVKMFACSNRYQLLQLKLSDISPEKQLDDSLSCEKEKEHIATAIEQGSHRFEWLHRRITGEEFSAEVLLTTISVNDEKIIHATLRDTSERKQAEDELRKERELRTKFIQSAPAFFVAIDGAGQILMMNEAMLQAVGYKLDEVLGKDYLSHFVPENEHKIVSDIFENLVTSKVETLNENNMLAKDGGQLLVEWHGRPILKKSGEVEYFFGVGIDITERKRAEQALKTALAEVEQLKNRLEKENLYLKDEINVTHNFEEIIGASNALKKALGKVEQVAASDSTVLILGETGTGKELIARAIHNLSRRSERPLVKVNCATLPANIIESELFGHEKGAFTGAYIRKIGRFELADQGTIFLDEIGDLALDLQVKLLRVLQGGEFERLGNPNTMKVDVRIIAATNRDLEKGIENGTFREDLYYRLNVFPIKVPSLRERKQDIPFLINHFLKKYCHKIGRAIEIIPQKVMDELLSYDWPGNIRELENIIERAVIVSKGNRLEPGDWLPQKTAEPIPGGMTTLEEVERTHIIKVLESTRWKVSGEKGAAKILGLNQNTLVSRMKKLNIHR